MQTRLLVFGIIVMSNVVMVLMIYILREALK